MFETPATFAAPRPAPSIRTPRFTRGDVLALMEPDTWISGRRRPPFYRTMWAAFAALAACARVTPCLATSFTLDRYEARELRAVTRYGHRYPILLLPVAVAAIERYLVLRRRLGGNTLFVSEDGSRLSRAAPQGAFRQLATQYGLHGGEILERLYEFHDRCFVDESDRAAVFALRRACPRLEEGTSMPDIVGARSDLRRLEKVLNRRHRLAGKPGRWLGGHGKAKIARETRLFGPVQAETPGADFMHGAAG